MPNPFLFSQLSTPRQGLVRLCQTTNYGLIERLQVRGSEPALEPPPLVTKDLKLDHDEKLRPELDLTDFELCSEVQRLMDHLDWVRNGIIVRVEVHAGIPRRIAIRITGDFTKLFSTHLERDAGCERGAC